MRLWNSQMQYNDYKLNNSTQLNFIKHICSLEAELLNTEAVGYLR